MDVHACGGCSLQDGSGKENAGRPGSTARFYALCSFRDVVYYLNCVFSDTFLADMSMIQGGGDANPRSFP